MKIDMRTILFGVGVLVVGYMAYKYFTDQRDRDIAAQDEADALRGMG